MAPPDTRDASVLVTALVFAGGDPPGRATSRAQATPTW